VSGADSRDRKDRRACWQSAVKDVLTASRAWTWWRAWVLWKGWLCSMGSRDGSCNAGQVPASVVGHASGSGPVRRLMRASLAKDVSSGLWLVCMFIRLRSLFLPSSCGDRTAFSAGTLDVLSVGVRWRHDHPRCPSTSQGVISPSTDARRWLRRSRPRDRPVHIALFDPNAYPRRPHDKRPSENLAAYPLSRQRRSNPMRRASH